MAEPIIEYDDIKRVDCRKSDESNYPTYTCILIPNVGGKITEHHVDRVTAFNSSESESTPRQVTHRFGGGATCKGYHAPRDGAQMMICRD